MSQENSPSTFIQDSPGLSLRTPSGFVCTWNDTRAGDPSFYAQDYDSLGRPIGHNYPTPGIDRTIVTPDGHALTLWSTVTSNSGVFEDVLTVRGIFRDRARQPIDTVVLASVYLPWCGTGYLGDDYECTAVGNRYLFVMRNDGYLRPNEYSADGEPLFAYPDSLFPWHAASTAAVAGLPTGHAMIAWYEVDPYDLRGRGFRVSFFDSNRAPLVTQRVLDIPSDTSNPGFWWLSRKMLKAVPLDDSAFLIVTLPPPATTLYWQKFDRTGVPTIGLDSLPVPVDGSSLPNLVLSSASHGRFHLLVSTTNSATGRSLNELVTFTTQGVLAGAPEIDSSGGLLSANFIVATDDSLLRIGTSSGGDVYLTAFRGLTKLDSAKVNDDTLGSNEVRPRVLPAGSGRVFFAWEDEVKVAGRFTDAAEAPLGPPLQLEGTYSKTAGFFRDGTIVSLWNGISAATQHAVSGYARYDASWHLVRRDTLGDAQTGSSVDGLGVLTDTTFLLVIRLTNATTLMILDTTGLLIRDTIVAGSWTGYLGQGDAAAFTVILADYSVPPYSYRALSLSNDLVPSTETPVTVTGTPVGYDRILQLTGSLSETRGTLLSFAGDTIAARFYLFGAGATLAGVASISRDTILVTYQQGAMFFAKAYSAAGFPLGDSVAVSELTTGRKKDLAFAIRGGNIYYAWSEVRPPAPGYSIFGNILEISRLVGTSEEGEALPAAYELSRNYPNPFNPSTAIRYALPAGGHAALRVYNLLGQLVATLVDRWEEAGWHVATFNARSLASGVYLYRLNAGQYNACRSMLLIR